MPDSPFNSVGPTRRRQLHGAPSRGLVGAASLWARQVAEEFDLAPEDIYRLDLCLSELVTNIVSHTPAGGSEVRAEIAIAPQHLALTVSDDAPPYNPFASMPARVRHAGLDAPVGGYGLHLMRDFSDAFHYERRAARNCVELGFLLRRPAIVSPGRVKVPRARERRRTLGSATSWKGDERRSGQERRQNGFLSWSQIFDGVPYADVEDIVERMPTRDYADETALLAPGDMNVEVLVVLCGNLRIWLEQPGIGEVIEIGPGGCAGEMSVIDGKPVSAHVIAAAGTRLLAIDASTFIDEMLTLRHVSRNLITAMAERMRRSNEQVIKRVRQELELEQIHRDLQRAQSIQRSLLPSPPLLPDETRLSCVGRMQTARDVGGDFYDLFRLGEDHVFFVVADVCGKGLPAALYMVRAIEGLRGHTSIGGAASYLAELANRFNRQMCAYNDAAQFLTAFLGVVDLRRGELHYVNAGHTPALLANGDVPFGFFSAPINPVFGMYEGLAYHVGTVALAPGSTLLLYTDGVTEAESPTGEIFGERRLMDCVNAATPRSAAGIADAVLTAAFEFLGDASASDDITLLAFSYPGAGR